MRRRQFAKMVGAGVAGIGLMGQVSARDEGDLPNDNVSDTTVQAIGAPKDDPIEVDTGDWITHGIGWVDREGEQAAEDVERWLDKKEFTAWIDGEKVENTDEHWGDVYYDEERGTYAVFWTYSVPPKSPGLYSYTARFEYPDGFYDGGEVAEPGAVFESTGYYKVVGGNSGKK